MTHFAWGAVAIAALAVGVYFGKNASQECVELPIIEAPAGE
ncbi:MAG: hypothetical protein ACR2QF_11005 [Geminicoccaceae bacterium]